jgi:hypothetical protein
MDGVMDAKAARSKLIAQHGRIRTHLSDCRTLARGLLDGQPVHRALDRALGRLRGDVIKHNTTETVLIRPLLRDSPGWGTLLIDRMLEAHVAEHAALCALLDGPVVEVAARIDELGEELDAHMAAEERTFLSPMVLRHDVITRHRQLEPT